VAKSDDGCLVGQHGIGPSFDDYPNMQGAASGISLRKIDAGIRGRSRSEMPPSHRADMLAQTRKHRGLPMRGYEH
jgi:hypothetical protein